MKLRPTPKDYKAIEALKDHYNEATGTKAILRAVRDVPGMQADIRKMEAMIKKQNAILGKINDGSAIMLGTLTAIKEYCTELNGQPGS